MDWEGLSAVDVFQLERNEALLDSLYEFLEKNQLTAAEAARAEAGRLAKILSVTQCIMKVKGEEAKVAMELLSQQQGQQGLQEGGAPSERDLMNQIVQLERELQERESVIRGLRERGSSPTPGAVNETRVLRQENEDLKLELGEVKRRLDHERGETDRLSGEAAAERVRSRQLEREADQLRESLEGYRKHLESHKEVGGGLSVLRAGEKEYRERLRNKDLEIAGQLDKIEDLLNVRDDLEQQRQELAGQLGQVEEMRIAGLREAEEARQALVEADQLCRELETKNSLLEGQVSDLRECLQEKTLAEQQTQILVAEKTKYWESVLSSKESQLAECQEEQRRLQSLLTAAERDSTRAAAIRMKKQLQERDMEVSELQEEMARGAAALEELSAQLEEERVRSNPSAANATLQKALASARVETESLAQALEQEVGRRRACEVSAAEKEAELTLALRRLGEYERGEYGLREAVQEIKVKKEEIAIRDKEIIELTQQVNLLDQQLNELSEFNEMLCGRLGVRDGEDVGFAAWREKRQGDREREREENRSLRREVERLEEEKLALRKRVVGLQLAGGRDGDDGEREGERERGREETDTGPSMIEELQSVIAELKSQVVQLQTECSRERREKARLTLRLKEQQHKSPVDSGGAVAVGGKGGESERKREGERERVRGREEMMEKELESTYRHLERKSAETERLEKENEYLRQAASGFQPVPLPECIPMTSRDVIASLNEHLLHALRAEKGRSQECETMRAALEKYQRKFSVIIHQQGILYKEYVEGRREWGREKEQMLQQVREMESLKEVEEMRRQELKALQDLLSSDPDTQRQRMAELSRQIVALCVNEKTLSRRYTLLHETEASLRKENAGLRNDLMILEKAVAERIGYLERHKEAMLFRLSSLQQQLSESIPATELQKANRQYSDLAVKYHGLLQREASQVVATQQVARLQAETRTVRKQLSAVREELSGEKQRSELLQRTVTHSTGTETETEGLQPSVAIGNRLATLEVKELNERQRADLATVRSGHLQESVSQLERRNAELEEKFSELTQRLLEAQSREAEMMERMADCLVQEDRVVLESEIATLRKCETQLKLENSQLKEVSEIARQQVVAMETWKKSHDMMMSSLRHQLLDAQTGSDDKTIVGKLQHQISTLQVCEATALKKLETANAKVLQLEASVLRSERQRDELLESAFHARSQSQTKITSLRTTIQALRRQYAGAVPLSEQEKQVELVLGLREQHSEIERLREEARRDRDMAQDKLAELELQQANLHELLAALKDPKNAAAKLTEWHAKLGEVRLCEMKALRNAEKSGARVRHLEAVMAESEKAFSKLEQDLVQVTKDYESSQLSWEQRELELEQQLRRERDGGRREREREGDGGRREREREGDGSRREGEREISRTEEAEVKQNQALVQSPLAAQLSQALTDLQRSSQRVANLRRETRQAEEQADVLERALRTAQNKLLSQEKEISELKLAAIRSEGSNREEWEGQRAELTAAQRARQIAEDTVEQLQTLITQKEAQSEKYQRLLQEARSQLQSITEAHKSEVASLVKKLHAQSDSAILKLKEATMEAVAVPTVAGATEEQLARLHELEDLIGQQRVSYEARLEGVKREYAQAKQVYETSLIRVRQEMGEMKQNHFIQTERLQKELNQQSTKVIGLEQELEVMSGELSAAQEAVKQAPSRTTKALVERLRQQLAVKEKQQKALNEAMLQVRAELLDATQKALEGHAQPEVTEANIQRLVEKRTRELEDRVEELSSSLIGMQTELERSRDQETEARRAANLASEATERLRSDEDRHRREEERRRREREEGRERVRHLEAELQQSRKTLEQGRSREQRLARELQALQQKADHRPEVEELQRKLKVVQSRLDRQKQKVTHVTAAQNQPPPPPSQPSVEATPQVSMRHSSEGVLRWEENKKWQRKIDGLRAKLSEKAKELETAQRQAASLREMLARADRERSLLQGKMKALQKSVADLERSKLEENTQSTGRHGDGSGSRGDGDGSHGDQYALRRRVFELEGEVSRLTRELSVDRGSEVREAQLRNQQLLKSVETLEQQQKLQSTSSAQLVSVRQRERELERELLKSQKENMELRFDYEQAVLELPRLRTRVRDQEQYIEMLTKAGDTEANRRNGTKVHPVGVASTGSHTPSLEELQRVISAMRSVVEKLQRENERLRREGKAGKERERERVRQLQGENRSMKEQLRGCQPGSGEGQATAAAAAAAKSPYSKIVSENERLRKSLKREMERNEKLNISLKTFEIQTSRLKEESEEVRPTTSHTTRGQEEEMERLRAEVEKKTQMLMEVKRHLREAAEREREGGQAQLVEERDALREQVQMLRKELDAFDPSFFEEVEDLKFNYQEAVKRNVQYEEQITRLSQQLGVSPPTFHV